MEVEESEGRSHQSSISHNPVRLNLGCGDKTKPGWTNVDLYNPQADISVDLFTFPWPWEDSSVDEIYMEHFLEHCPDIVKTIVEVHRVLKPSGRWTITVPHARGIYAHSIGHKNLMTYCFFESLCRPETFFDPEHKAKFKTIKFNTKILKLPFIKWTPFDWVASRHPLFWEKVSFSILTPTEMTWTGEAIKQP